MWVWKPSSRPQCSNIATVSLGVQIVTWIFLMAQTETTATELRLSTWDKRTDRTLPSQGGCLTKAPAVSKSLLLDLHYPTSLDTKRQRAPVANHKPSRPILPSPSASQILFPHHLPAAERPHTQATSHISPTASPTPHQGPHVRLAPRGEGDGATRKKGCVSRGALR